MLIALWSLKGGQGVSVTAGLLALTAVTHVRPPEKVCLVDLCGDQLAVFGADEQTQLHSTGISEWSSTALSTKMLDRSMVDLTPDLALLPAGQSQLEPGRAGELVEYLRQMDTPVVVDAGAFSPGWGPVESDHEAFRREVVHRAGKSAVVTRACYLSLRRIASAPIKPTEAVLVAEAGRSLTRADCERVIGAPVVATVPIRTETAQAVDAGKLRTAVPNQAIRALGNLADQFARPAPTLAPAIDFG
ncbi:MAG: hypothetical protein F4Y28_02220 [Acidimicrobiia bacterium]|nr:hypothetical protein [Acidimicrobiia bacterium]MYJ31739.1 hypothetical protein [Acidimicrobiia bacterium]